MHIAEVDLHGDEDVLREWWDYLHRTYSVIVEPYRHLLTRERNVPDFFHVRHWLARDDSGRVAGAGQLRWYDSLDNQHRADSRINLLPADGASFEPLLDALRAGARSLGRTTLGIDARTGSVEAAGASRAGARMCIRELHSVCPVGSLDRAKLELPAPVGYELVRWTGPCPDELLDDLVRMNNVMNTAPRGEMDLEDIVFTAHRQRAWEDAYARRGWTRWAAAAREIATGQLVAYTELTIFDDHQTLIEQDNTAVDPAHRGRGLAKFVKAANLLRVLDERPHTGHVQTWNADTNAAMLAVNFGLGFVPVDGWEGWEMAVG